MNKGKLALDLMRWHSSGGCPIYVLGSNLYSVATGGMGRITNNMVMRAIKKLQICQYEASREEESILYNLITETAALLELEPLLIIKIDETEHWRRDIQTAAGQLFGIYIVDPNTHHHLCSFQANYWLEHLSTHTTNELDDDMQELLRIIDDQSHYIPITQKFDVIEKWEIDKGEYVDDKDEYIEYVKDYLQGNPPV